MNGYRIAGVAIIMAGFLMSFGLAFGVPPIIKGSIVGGGIGLDGSGQCTNSSTCFLTLTTSSANDVVIVAQASNNNGNCGVLAIPTATGLSFIARVRVNAPSGWNICEYYAIAPSALSSATITCAPNYAWGRTSCIAFGVSGANTASPFDGNPCTNSGTSSTPFCLVTTTNPNDFIIGLSTTNTPTTATSGIGFTTIFDQSSDNNGNSFAEYGTVSTLQQSAPVGLTYATSTSWGMIADAIKLSATTSTTTATTSTSSAGQVTQPLAFGAIGTGYVPSATIAVYGCGANPASFYGNGATATVFANPSCTLTLTLPSGWYFLSGGAQVQSLSFQTCASGTCNTFGGSYYVTGSATTTTTTVTITSSGTVTTSVITTTVTSTSSANPFVLPAALTANPFNFVVGLLLIPSGVIVYTRKNEGG